MLEVPKILHWAPREHLYRNTDQQRLPSLHLARCPPGKSSQPAPVAAITEPSVQATASAPELVATIFLQAVNIMADTSTSESSDTSVTSVSPAPPLKGKHLIWTCWVNNPTDRISVKTLALIDSGAHMVLICPDLVKHLNLVSHPLKQPEQISVALSSTDQIDCYVTVGTFARRGLSSTAKTLRSLSGVRGSEY